MGFLEPRFLLWRCLKGSKCPHSPRKHTALLLHSFTELLDLPGDLHSGKARTSPRRRLLHQVRLCRRKVGTTALSHCTCLLAFAQEGLVCCFCRNKPENNFVVFGPELIDKLMGKSPSSAAKVPPREAKEKIHHPKTWPWSFHVLVAASCSTKVSPHGGSSPLLQPTSTCLCWDSRGEDACQGSASLQDGAHQTLCPEAGMC